MLRSQIDAHAIHNAGCPYGVTPAPQTLAMGAPPSHAIPAPSHAIGGGVGAPPSHATLDTRQHHLLHHHHHHQHVGGSGMDPRHATMDPRHANMGRPPSMAQASGLLMTTGNNLCCVALRLMWFVAMCGFAPQIFIDLLRSFNDFYLIVVFFNLFSLFSSTLPDGSQLACGGVGVGSGVGGVGGAVGVAGPSHYAQAIPHPIPSTSAQYGQSALYPTLPGPMINCQQQQEQHSACAQHHAGIMGGEAAAAVAVAVAASQAHPIGAQNPCEPYLV